MEPIAMPAKFFTLPLLTPRLLPAACLLVLSTAEMAAADSFTTELVPLLRTFCYDCHGQSDGEGGVSLAADDSPEKIAASRGHWMRAAAQVRLGTMPPADGEPMDPASRASLADLIDRYATSVNCEANPNAGKVAMRRLNRTEYRNTILDLVGVDYAPAADFPADDVGYGFDNIGDVLSLPPLLMERYLAAAEAITGMAIVTPPGPRTTAFETSADVLDGDGEDQGRDHHLYSDGSASMTYDAPIAGRYVLTITASGTQGGDQPCRMGVRVGSQSRTIDVPESEPTDKVVEVRLREGPQKVEVAFLNDYYRQSGGEKEDRNLAVHHLHFAGTEIVSSRPVEPSAMHRRLIFLTPQKDVTEAAATAAVIGRFASRAYRRPVRRDELVRLNDLAQSVRDGGGSFEESIQVAMQAVLISPYFLFRVERPREVIDAEPMPAISDYELATRISYFLWSSMPDDELLSLAHQNRLRDPGVLLDKIGRMIADDRSRRLVDGFASQWLQLRMLDDLRPDTRIYRGFNEDIRAALKHETLLFVEEVFRHNRPATDLIDADYTFLNEPLAQFYNIRGVRGNDFRLVSLTGQRGRRGGILTHASVLTVTSNPTRTSPVKRGKWILENVLGMPPPPAPPGIPELDRGPLAGTLRQRMEQHRADPACATCHSMMDPLGFALENYNAVGQWRSRDGSDPIDPSGELPDGTKFSGAGDLKALLAGQRKEQFIRCLTDKLLIYATGRGTEYYDRCAIDQIMSQAAPKDYRFAYLLLGIIQSDPFQKQGYRE